MQEGECRKVLLNQKSSSKHMALVGTDDACMASEVNKKEYVNDIGNQLNNLVESIESKNMSHDDGDVKTLLFDINSSGVDKCLNVLCPKCFDKKYVTR